MATQIDIARLVATLRAAFPSWLADEQTVNIWFTLLKDLPANELNAAVLAYCTQPGRAYAPSVGELRGMVVELKARASGVPEVYEAWEELLKAPPDMLVRYPPVWSEERQLWVLPQSDYRWSHPLVERVARQLGWPDSFPGDNLSVSLAQFRDAYQASYRKETREAAELPEVTAFVNQQRQQIAADVGKLAKKLERSSGRDDP
jgi:hypothetical protein